MIPYVIRSEEPVPFGMDRDVMLSLAKALNLKLTFLFAKKIPHIVTMIVKGQADMSISHASLLYGFWSKGVDISTTLRTKSLIFAVGHDVPIESYATVILSPFTNGVWLSTLGSFLAVLLVIGVLNKYFNVKY